MVADNGAQRVGGGDGENEPGSSASAAANMNSVEEPVRVPEGEYARYLASQAAEIADSRSARREAIYRGLIGVVVAVLAFFGYTNLSSLRTDLKEVLKAELAASVATEVESTYSREEERLVSKAINRIQRDVDAKLAFAQLFYMTKELEKEPEAIRISERDAAISLLESAGQSAELRKKPEFVAALVSIVGVLFKADLEQHVDALHDEFRDLMVRNSDVVTILVVHYGLRVSGGVASDPVVRERYREYSKAARMVNYPEVALPFDLAVAFMDAGLKRNDVTDNLWLDATTLDPSETRTFLKHVDMYALADESSDANGKLMRVARLFEALGKAYDEEAKTIRSDLNDEEPSAADLDDLLRRLTERATGLEPDTSSSAE